MEEYLDIKFENVLDLAPKKLTVLVSEPFATLGISAYELDHFNFERFKFHLIKWIKKRPNPEDRVLNFEALNEDGVWDYDRESFLIETRKSREEKQKEKDDEMAMREKAKELGIEWPT